MSEARSALPVVLVVDDEPDHIALVAGVLRRAGMEVLTSTRAEEAVEIAATTPPDAAVLDVMMDHLVQGFDLARSLRSTYPELPILFLSGLGQVYDLESQVGEEWLPGDRLLHKPASPEAIAEEVRRLLARRRTGSSDGS